MHPFFTVLGRTVPLYGCMAVAGVLAALIYLKVCEPKRDFPPADAELALAYCVIGIFVGAKVLYLLTIWPQFTADFPRSFSEPFQFAMDYLGGGFNFYGGFYGGVATCVIYTRVTHLDFWELMRSFVPMVPLFHAFGRIGCFLAGCCYGIENETLGVVFTESVVAPNGVPLIPVQLYEAAGEAALFVLTACLASRSGSGRQIFFVWLIGYGVLRFLLEFLRGDDYRGFIGVFSISQVIALISAAWGAFLLIRARKGVPSSGCKVEEAAG